MTVADKAYVNGNIYCVIPRGEFASAIAIKEGKFLAVGTDEDIEPYISSSTKVIDLHERTVLPSFHEPHIHAINGAYKHLFRCNLPEGEGITKSDIINTIKQYVETNKNREWIIGGNWPFEFIDELHKDLLDEIDKERPMVFLDFSTHNAWVNSRALEIACIDALTPDPSGGKIVKDRNGEPTGILLENAVNLIHSHIPEMTKEEALESVIWVSDYLNSFGFTAIKDPAVDANLLHAYKRAVMDNKFNLRLATSLVWKSDYANNVPYEVQKELIERRQQYEHEKINPHFAKIFIDGVPAYKTAAFLEPYVGEEKANHCWEEMLLIEPEEIKADLIALDKEGITVKMHATGDAAVRLALDAIEAARKENGDSGLLHEVAHNGFVHKQDIPRFKELNAVAEFSPPFWFPSDFQQLKEKILGKERADETYPIKSVHSTNALVVCGSDWPIIPEPNPWISIESLITRSNPYTKVTDVLNRNEAIDLEEALELFTINASKSMYTDKLSGSIEVGKYADFIIINQNIFNIPNNKISNTEVLTTIMEGEVIYSKDKVPS